MVYMPISMNNDLSILHQNAINKEDNQKTRVFRETPLSKQEHRDCRIRLKRKFIYDISYPKQIK